MKKRLLIIDAHALIHRAFHALPPLSTKNGEPINALYGFLLITLAALKDLKPEYVAVAFDSKGKTFRHKQYKLYKANRDAPPEELISQFPKVREMMDAFGFPTFAETGWEADDIIGTICKQFDNDGSVETIVLTGDMDMLQLVDKNTKVMRVKRGVKDTTLYTPATVKEEYGFTPKQVIEYKGLRGDSSDNIPGVKGVGEKTAKELLADYGDIKTIYKNIEKITGRARKALEGNEADAELSRELATIAKNAPITFSLGDSAVGKYDQKIIGQLFQKYEFKSLLNQLSTLPGFQVEEGLFEKPEAREKKRAGFDYQLTQTDEAIEALAAQLAEQTIFAFDTETTGLDPLQDDLVGISFSFKKGQGFYVPTGPQVPAVLAAVLENPAVHKVAHNAKFDIKVLHHAGVQIQGVTYDTMIASYLLNSGARSHGLDNLVFSEFGHEMQPIEELIGKGKKQISMADVEVERVSWYAAEDADFTWRLYEKFEPLVRKNGFEELMTTMEMPTLHTLVGMEESGIMLDVPFLNSMSKKLHKRIAALDEKIQETAGAQFNVASNVQLKEILFEKMGLPTDKIKKTKTGYSTAASELEKMRGVHPIIDMISEFRELTKLTSTYLDTLPLLVNKNTNRVHTTYSQTIAATGRLSSIDPNLQNIPIRTELGREIRKAFIAEEGMTILSLDYSQIELRIAAHLANDKMMIESFQNGEDIHSRTAAALGDKNIEDVSKDERRSAKAINFGVLYGMGVQGIMRDSGVGREEARDFLDKYFSVHKGIYEYMENVKAETRKTGYAETVFGRRRPLPDINSKNRMIMAAAERAAINMPVQGTAADIMKLAMIAVAESITKGDVQARMLLQVHDELVFEVEDALVEQEAAKIKEIMEGVYTLKVPLIVEVDAGRSWGELNPLS